MVLEIDGLFIKVIYFFCEKFVFEIFLVYLIDEREFLIILNDVNKKNDFLYF